MSVLLRPMTGDDIEAVDRLAERAFEAARSTGQRTAEPPAQPSSRMDLTRYLLTTDPAGAWVCDQGDGPVGAAQAVRREGLWILSLLAVDPDVQSGGTGRALLQRALAYSDGCAGGLLISSADPRAMRSYARAGFELHATVGAVGAVDRSMLPAPGPARDGELADLDLVGAVDRQVRGAPHGPDAEALLRAGGRMVVVDTKDGHGYAFHRAGHVFLLAATVPDVARVLLWTCLAQSEGDDARVAFMTGAQQWAIEVVVAAGLQLQVMGPVCRRGALGPLTPYLPNGPLL